MVLDEMDVVCEIGRLVHELFWECNWRYGVSICWFLVEFETVSLVECFPGVLHGKSNFAESLIIVDIYDTAWFRYGNCVVHVTKFVGMLLCDKFVSDFNAVLLSMLQRFLRKKSNFVEFYM